MVCTVGWILSTFLKSLLVYGYVRHKTLYKNKTETKDETEPQEVDCSSSTFESSLSLQFLVLIVNSAIKRSLKYM